MTPSKEQVEEAKLAAAEKVGLEKAAALRQARRDALEEAAKVCDLLAQHWHECAARGDEAVAAERCAIAIRWEAKPVPDAADTKAARELADKISTRNVSSNVDRIRDSQLLLYAGPLIAAQADTIAALRAQLESWWEYERAASSAASR